MFVKKEMKADLGLLGVTVVWGTSFPIMSVVLKYVKPYTLISSRYLLAGVILSLFFIKRLKKADKKTLLAGFYIGLSLLFGSGLQILGLMYTTPSKSGFITGLNVVMVPVFLAIIYKKMPNGRTIIGVVLSVLGLALMSGGGLTGFNRGDFLTLLCAVACAIQIILVDRFARDVDIAVLTIIELITTGVIGLIPAVLIEKVSFQVNVLSVSSVLWLALFCTIGAYGVQNVAQPYTEPTHAAIIFLAEPVFSAIFSIFIGDRLSGMTLVGCLLIFIGMAVINLNLIMKKGTSKVKNIDEEENT